MGFFGSIGDCIGGIGNGTIKLASAGVNGVLNTTTNVVSAPISLLSGDTSGAAQNMKDAGSNVTTMVKDSGAAVGGIWNSATAPVSSLFSGIQSAGHSIDGFFSNKSTPAQAKATSAPVVVSSPAVTTTAATVPTVITSGAPAVTAAPGQIIIMPSSGYTMPNFGYGMSNFGGGFEMGAFAGLWQQLVQLRDHFLAKAMASLNNGNQQVVANGTPQNVATNATGGARKSVPVVVEDSGETQETGKTKGGKKSNMSKERTALLEKIKAQDAELVKQDKRIGELKDKIAEAKGEKAQSSSVDRDLVTQNMIKELKDKVSELSAKVDGTADKSDETVDTDQLIKKSQEQYVEKRAKAAEIKKLEQELKALQAANPKGATGKKVPVVVEDSTPTETPATEGLTGDAKVDELIRQGDIVSAEAPTSTQTEELGGGEALAGEFNQWIKDNADSVSKASSETFNFGGDIYVDGKKGPETYKAAVEEFSKARMALMDTDKDGTISAEEFKNYELSIADAITDEQQRNEAKANLTFKHTASDGTKYDNAAARFSGVDYNGDGKIDADELLADTVYLDNAKNENGEYQVDCKLSPSDLLKRMQNPDRQKRVNNKLFNDYFGRDIGG